MEESINVEVYHAAIDHLFRRWDAYLGECPESLWLYQTSGFMVASPSSATASVFRLITGKDMKGVPVLLLKYERSVLFLPINERAQKMLTPLAGTSQAQIKTTVALMDKGKPPPGLLLAMKQLKDSKVRTLGIMSADIESIEKSGNKLMEELRTQVSTIAGLSMSVDATGLVYDILTLLPSSYHNALRAASNEALSCYVKVFASLEKMFNAGRCLESPRRVMLDSVISSVCGGAVLVSKDIASAQGTRYIQLTDTQLAALNRNAKLSAFISLVSTATSDLLAENIAENVHRALHAPVLGHGFTNELQTIVFTGETTGRAALTTIFCNITKDGITAAVIRTVACAHDTVSGVIQSAFEAVERAHRGSFDLLEENISFSEFAQRRLTAYADFETSFTCKRTNFAVQLAFNKVELGAICGAAGGSGLATSEQIKTGNNVLKLTPLCLGQESSSAPTAGSIITASTPLFLVTAAHVTLSNFNVSFDIVYGDTILLALARPGETKHILTGPDEMRNSTAQCLRYFFMVNECNQTRSQGQAPSHTQASESSDSDESSDQAVNARRDKNIEERRQVRQERANRQQALHESQERLGKELRARIEERYKSGRQKFRKEGVTRSIPAAFNSVDEYPSVLGGDDSTIYKMSTSDTLFVMLNNRPIPLHPSTIHSVRIAGVSETDAVLIRMQFAAQGVVTGKARENYPQLEQYGAGHTFLKEILFECSRDKAEQIVEELNNHLTTVRQKQQSELHADEPMQIDMDIDNLLGEAVKTAILKNEPLSPFQPTNPNYFSLSQSNLHQALQMRPNIERRRSRDGGELQVHENGLRYRFLNSMGNNVVINILYKNIKTCVFEKLRDSSHIAILYFMFRVPTSIKQLIPSALPRGEYDDAVLAKAQHGITFLCNFETGVRLSSGVKPKTDRDEIEQEREASHNMRKANKIYDQFLSCISSALHAYKEKNPVYAGVMFKTCTRDRNYPSFSASYQGNQTFHIYRNKRIGCMEPKTQFIVAAEDLDLIVFENLNLYRDSTFHMTFHYRDIRMDPVTISSIQSKYIHDLQDWANAMGVKYYITQETTKWKDFTAKYYNKREDYDEFLENGGWDVFFGSDSESSSEVQDDDSDAFQEDYEDEDEDDYDEFIDSSAKSESDHLQGDDEFESEIIDFEEESESDHRDYKRRR